MAFAEWTNDYSVNVAEIDDQHKKLFAMIDEYYQALGRKEQTEALAELLEGLAQYAATHFHNEEVYFDKFGYQHAEAHKQAHADLVARVTDIAARARQGVAVLNMELATFLRDWLNEHIKGLDTQYSQCFNEIGETSPLTSPPAEPICNSAPRAVFYSLCESASPGPKHDCSTWNNRVAPRVNLLSTFSASLL